MASLFLIFFPLYLFTAYRRDLLNGSQMFRVGIPLAVGGAVFLTIGFGWRCWRLKKRGQHEQSKARLAAGLVQRE
jgi:predicted permease